MLLNVENPKSNIFCFFSDDFLERKPDENRHGELSEWSKVQHSKSPSANGIPSSEKPLTVRVSGIRQPQAHREF